MPKPYSLTPSRLQRLALKLVISKFEDVFVYISKSEGHGLQKLSGRIAEELIVGLKHSEKCNVFLKSTTGKHIRHINLQGAKNIQDETVSYIADACQNVSWLNVNGCQQLSPDTLCYVVRSLSQLTDLDLSYTTCNDNVLSKLAQHCRNIQKLNVAHTNVTDLGVLALCGDINQAQARCNKLEWLDLSLTKVGEQSLTIALVKLKSLTYLNHQDLADLLTSIHGNHYDNHQVAPENVYKFQSMAFKSEIKEDGWLQKCVQTVCAYCPYLTEVTICDPEENCLTPLTKLKHIKCLVLQTWHHSSFNNMEELSYFLWGRGHNLSQLHLENVQDIDLCAVGQWCSGLEVLAITLPNIAPVEREPCNGPCQKKTHFLFNKLRSFSLSCWSDNVTYPVTSHALKVLLEGAVYLQSLHLCNLPSLTEEVLSEAMETNPLYDLTEVRLRNCDKISGDALLQLVLNENDLQVLEITNCKLVEQYHVDEMKATIKESNYTTKLQFTST